MPDVARRVGRTVPRPEGGALAQAISDALDGATEAARQAARQRVVDRYAVGRRRAALTGLIDRLVEP